MGVESIKSQVIADTTLTASTLVSADLGVNGLSFLLLHLTGLQAADNVEVQANDLLDCLSNITVSYRGQAIISGNGRDIARMGLLASGWSPIITHAAEAANAETGITFPIPFGRRLWGLKEGFGPVNRGELSLAVTPAASFGDVVTPELNVQQVEMPGVRFQSTLKYTTRAATPAGTGDFDWLLPIGNVMRGILIFTTTTYRNLNARGGIADLRILANNTERLFTGGDAVFEYWLAHAKRGRQSFLNESARMSDIAAAYTQFQSTRAIHVATIDFLDRYLYVDFDPTDDDQCSFDTKGLSDLVLRTNVNTAEAMRVLPLEVVPLALGK